MRFTPKNTPKTIKATFHLHVCNNIYYIVYYKSCKQWAILTSLCLPLKTTANAPCPIRSFRLNSNFPTVSMSCQSLILHYLDADRRPGGLGSPFSTASAPFSSAKSGQQQQQQGRSPPLSLAMSCLPDDKLSSSLMFAGRSLGELELLTRLCADSHR